MKKLVLTIDQIDFAKLELHGREQLQLEAVARLKESILAIGKVVEPILIDGQLEVLRTRGGSGGGGEKSGGDASPATVKVIDGQHRVMALKSIVTALRQKLTELENAATIKERVYNQYAATVPAGYAALKQREALALPDWKKKLDDALLQASKAETEIQQALGAISVTFEVREMEAGELSVLRAKVTKRGTDLDELSLVVEMAHSGAQRIQIQAAIGKTARTVQRALSLAKDLGDRPGVTALVDSLNTLAEAEPSVANALSRRAALLSLAGMLRAENRGFDSLTTTEQERLLRKAAKAERDVAQSSPEGVGVGTTLPNPLRHKALIKSEVTAPPNAVSAFALARAEQILQQHRGKTLTTQRITEILSSLQAGT